MKTLISIDPGMSTGVVVGAYSDDQPFKLTHAFQFEGGVEGFLAEVHVSDDFIAGRRELVVSNRVIPPGEQFAPPHTYHPLDHIDFDQEQQVIDGVVIAEKFTARGSGNGFSYRTEALEPLRVEGAILAMGLDPEWCSPAQQYFAGGKGAEAKKRAHTWLKDNGLYISPKSVGCKDANDARSAALHAIAYLRRIQHMPTLKHYFGGENV